MKLKTKINLFLFTVLALLSISIIATGYLTINKIIYDLYSKQFSRELININQEVLEAYQVIEDAGIAELESYVLAAQKDLLSKLKGYHFGDSGVLYVLDNKGTILLKSNKLAPDIPIESYLNQKPYLHIDQHNKDNQISFIIDKEKYFSVFDVSPIWDWLIIISINENEIFTLRNQYLYYVSLISLVIFLLVFSVSLLFANIIRVRINNILTYLQRMGAGEHSLRIPVQGKNEFSEIGGEINSMIAEIDQEIALRKVSEKQLILAKEEAEAANKAKSEFLSSMSHELRTPMNAILGFSQLILMDDSFSEETKDSVQEIYNAGQHLLNLINGILDLSKIESGNVELFLEIIDVTKVINECLSLISPIAQKHNIKINFSPIETGLIKVDYTKLKQIILNLLSNAIKYNCTNGSVNLIVEAPNNDWLYILVNDTGQGIPSEKLSELFKPFNRLGYECSNIEGTGIGLTLTRSIIEMMGGKISVESKVGVGSTFILKFPRNTT